MSDITPAGAEDPRVAVFVACGLDAKAAAETVNNKKVAATFLQILEEAGVAATGCDRAVGQALYACVSKVGVDSSALVKTHRHELWQRVVAGGIRSAAQIAAAAAYFKKQTAFDTAAFDKECGVGVVVTAADIDAAIAAALASSDVATTRYAGAAKVFGAVKETLKWADGLAVKTAFDAAVLALLGPKTEADHAASGPKNNKKEQAKAAAEAAEAAAAKAKAAEAALAAGGAAAESVEFARPPEDYLVGRDLEWARNTEEQMQRHLAATKGRVVTRFPPEPNGYLHIGHAKAMAQNFGVAAQYGGQCIMRFDDTNPEAEEQEYIDTILENLAALGHVPARTTYSSDYFGQLYDLAVQLITQGDAYVCHQSKEDIKRDRDVYKATGTCPPSPYRDRSVEENLRLFTAMRDGKCAENECTLRMKGDLSSPNPNMLDTVFYRVRYTPHPHTGDKWCVYPTYDYTHCIIDSLEDITYSMCTLEFEIRRESYFWLLHKLNLYKPKVWEYSRLNITHNVLSKRRLRALVEEGHVRGWDDPRLLTINGLRRRGIPPAAINAFIKTVGVSRNAGFVPAEKLDGVVRDTLNTTAPRAMAVVRPLKLTITNWAERPAGDAAFADTLQAPDFPAAVAALNGRTGSHAVAFTPSVWIEASDFMLEPTPEFLRLSVGREAHLKGAVNVTVTEAKTDAAGAVVELLATADWTNARRPFAKLHWVGGAAPLKAEVRLYDKLFMSEDPMALPGGAWQADLNPASLVVVEDALVDASVAATAGAPLTAFQFERLGYFAVDSDSTYDPATGAGRLVLNRVCELSAGNSTKAAKKAQSKAQ